MSETRKITRDYAAEYRTARTDYRRPGATPEQQGVARKAGISVARAADRAGVDLDTITIDEEVRRSLYPAGK
jgi:hypothetical protein